MNNIYKYWITLTILIFVFGNVCGQKMKPYDIYYFQLTDKQSEAYSIFHPEEYLSPRALERRERQGIMINETDLPLNPVYIQKIEALGGEIHAQSKWLNAVAVYIQDSAVLDTLKKQPFVVASFALGKHREAQEVPKKIPTPPRDTNYQRVEHSRYGYGDAQIRICNGHILHKFGYEGEGMHIAVFDGGFNYVHFAAAFDSLRNDGRILATKDFVEGDDYVYESANHGMTVLSTMAANTPNVLVGTAPKASYYLAKTEDTNSELWIEEFNWIAAAEWADSMGVDVINSSLGYIYFNDSTMHHAYDEINGIRAMITQGADMAVEKGILVLNSAGNKGNDAWGYIGVPADGFNVMAVGAVTAKGKKAAFSSFGPTSDGRIKPNVMAVGERAAVASVIGYEVSATNGTSFASPIMAGMATSYWQAFPDLTALEVKSAIEQSAHQAETPDSLYGYGIPNFYGAYMMQREAVWLVDLAGNGYSTISVVDDELSILIEENNTSSVELVVYNKLGQIQYSSPIVELEREVYELTIPNLIDYTPGVYWGCLRVGDGQYWFELIKS